MQLALGVGGAATTPPKSSDVVRPPLLSPLPSLDLFGAPVALTRTLIIIYVAEERCREKMRHERKMDSD